MTVIIELQKKYYEELDKEKGIKIIRKERIHIIDEFKELIINKLEIIPDITANYIYYFIKKKKNALDHMKQ